MTEFSNLSDNTVSESEGSYDKYRKSSIYRRVYCTGTPTIEKEKTNSQSYLIRIGYEEVDLQGLPSGSYWWQDDEGNVQRFIKE